ncbi:hypothetical protein, partial [Prevotella brunnea]|uniref:hypothetical protein n=1 Tax=Prevotella brunnea TaxID=2508867 RepID=UPI00195F7C36
DSNNSFFCGCRALAVSKMKRQRPLSMGRCLFYSGYTLRNRLSWIVKPIGGCEIIHYLKTTFLPFTM